MQYLLYRLLCDVTKIYWSILTYVHQRAWSRDSQLRWILGSMIFLPFFLFFFISPWNMNRFAWMCTQSCTPMYTSLIHRITRTYTYVYTLKKKHIHTRTNPITQHTRTYTHERTRERTPAKREGKWKMVGLWTLIFPGIFEKVREGSRRF